MRPGARRAHVPRRRVIALTAGASAVMMAAAACGGGDSGGDQVTLRFSWWGADDRHATTQEVIERFEAAHPDISVEGEYTDWESYWDRLATNAAANDMPDVITQEERYLREYGDRGALLDLNDHSDTLDLSDIDDMALGGGEVDGALYGVATGVNAYSILADPRIFEDAGVEMPDDETWTWQDYVDVAAEISENTDDDVYGAQSYIFNEAGFQIFARQRGENIYDEEGDLAFSEETLAEWYEIALELQETGGEPEPELSVEVEAGGPDQGLVATNSGAMSHFWSNQLGGISNSADRRIELLRYPGESEHEQPGMFLKPAMYYSAAASTDHPEEAAMFIDFLLNDEQAVELILSDRGLPANTELRAGIREDLPPADQQSAEFIEEIQGDLAGPNPVPPIGAGEVVDITSRIGEEVLFGNLTPEEAAEQFMREVESATGE